MALTPEQTVIYRGYLTSAEQAYHDLRIGGMAKVFVDQNGERVEYALANAAGLRSYILELKIALGENTGIVGPLNVWSL